MCAKMPAIRTRAAIASDLKVARSRLTRARNAHARSDGGEEADVLLGAILERESEVAELLVERATLYPPVAAVPEEAVTVAAAPVVAAALEAAVPMTAAPEAAVPGMAVQEAAVPDAEGLAEGAQAASFAELARAILAGLTPNGVAIRSLTTALTKRERQGEDGVELRRRRQEMSPWERALAEDDDDEGLDGDSLGGGARGGAVVGLGSDWRVLDPATWGPLRTGEDRLVRAPTRPRAREALPVQGPHHPVTVARPPERDRGRPGRGRTRRRVRWIGGVAEPCASRPPITLPVFTILKQNGKKRLLVDGREFDARSCKMPAPRLPHLEAFEAFVLVYERFSVIDFLGYFLQIPIEESLRKCLGSPLGPGVRGCYFRFKVAVPGTARAPLSCAPWACGDGLVCPTTPSPCTTTSGWAVVIVRVPGGRGAGAVRVHVACVPRQRDGRVEEHRKGSSPHLGECRLLVLAHRCLSAASVVVRTVLVPSGHMATRGQQRGVGAGCKGTRTGFETETTKRTARGGGVPSTQTGGILSGSFTGLPWSSRKCRRM